MTGQAPSPAVTARTIVPCLLLVLAVAALVYRPAVGGPFLLDDFTNVPQAYLERFSLGALLEIALGNESGPLGRPLPVASFALNYLLGDGGTAAFKLTNLALHAVNALLVYALCRILLPFAASPVASSARPPSPAAVAILLTAIWTLHPLQLSTVMYVVQRMTLMMTGFTLLALTGYAVMRRAQMLSDGRSLHLAAAVVLCTALACLCKENGALIPLYALLFELLVFRFRSRDAVQRARFVATFSVVVVAPLLIGGALVAWRFDGLMESYATRDFDMMDRLRTQPGVVLAYVKMILLPNLAEMSFYHDHVRAVRAPTVASTLAAVLVVASALAVPLLARRALPLALGLGLFIVSHLVESTVLPLEQAFEHRNYIGVLWLWLPICWYAVAWSRRVRPTAAAVLALALLPALLAFQTFSRSTEWSSDLGLNALAFENRPDSSRARTGLLVAMARRGRIDEAIERTGLDPVGSAADTHLPLVAVQLLALEDRRDGALLAYAETTLARGTVTADVDKVLHSLFANDERGVNGPLDTDDVLALHAAALANPRRTLSDDDERTLRGRHAALLAKSARASLPPRSSRGDGQSR